MRISQGVRLFGSAVGVTGVVCPERGSPNWTWSGLQASKIPIEKPAKPDSLVWPGFIVRLGTGSRPFFESGRTGRTRNRPNYRTSPIPTGLGTLVRRRKRGDWSSPSATLFPCSVAPRRLLGSGCRSSCAHELDPRPDSAYDRNTSTSHDLQTTHLLHTDSTSCWVQLRHEYTVQLRHNWWWIWIRCRHIQYSWLSNDEQRPSNQQHCYIGIVPNSGHGRDGQNDEGLQHWGRTPHPKTSTLLGHVT
jgi:hypothetical protein